MNRRAVAPNVYADAYGFQVAIKRKGRTYSLRLPPDSTEADWHRATADLLEQVGEPRPTTQSLRTAVERYMRGAKHLADPGSQQAHLRAFLPKLGDKDWRRIARADILQLRSDWRQDGIAPKTCNNRLSALRALYHALGEDDGATPCDRIKPLSSHREPPRAVSAAIIRRVEAALLEREQAGYLRDRKTRARFRILTTTGARPSELMRAEEGDVDLRRRVWQTRDGKGGYRPLGIPLTSAAVQGWQLFIEADAWGDFNTGSYAKVLRSAGWPRNVRPYHARHSLGDALDEAGVDLADIALLLGHTRPDTTRKHYVRAKFAKMQQAMKKLAGRVTWD